MVMQKPLLNAEKSALLIDRTALDLIKKTNSMYQNKYH